MMNRGEASMKKKAVTFEANRRLARRIWHAVSAINSRALRQLTDEHRFSLALGDLLLLEGRWYVTHTGLLTLARSRRCAGINVQPVPSFSDPTAQRWAFKATVFRTRTCKGFVGYGDADPSNVSPLMHGAEMRVSETRAANRALRKAFGIGICSVDEIGSSGAAAPYRRQISKILPQPANVNYVGPMVLDRLC